MIMGKETLEGFEMFVDSGLREETVGRNNPYKIYIPWCTVTDGKGFRVSHSGEDKRDKTQAERDRATIERDVINTARQQLKTVSRIVS
jgi:hypothetical protein